MEWEYSSCFTGSRAALTKSGLHTPRDHSQGLSKPNQFAETRSFSPTKTQSVGPSITRHLWKQQPRTLLRAIENIDFPTSCRGGKELLASRGAQFYLSGERQWWRDMKMGLCDKAALIYPRGACCVLCSTNVSIWVKAVGEKEREKSWWFNILWNRQFVPIFCQSR